MTIPTFSLDSEDAASRFLGRTTLFIGNGETGKTTAIHNLMKRFSSAVSGAIVFCETAESNDSFKGIVHDRCVYPEAEADIVSRVYQVQKNRSERFKMATELERLQPLFRRVADPKDLAKERKILRTVEKFLGSAKGEAEKNNIQKQKTKSLRKLYAKVVSKRGVRVAQEPMDKVVVRYCGMKVGVFMIFDDCSAVLSTLCSDDDLQRIFFQGRHDFLTALVSIHDFTILPTKMRTNSHNIIFTDAPSALAYIGNKRNGVSREQCRQISEAADVINRHAGDKSYNILYSRGSMPPISILRTSVIPRFRFGSRAVWKFLDRIPVKKREEKILDVDNGGGFY